MFDSDKKKNQSVKQSETTTTIVGQGAVIDGKTFKATGSVRIDGVYIGEMLIDGHLVVGQTGDIRGNITSNTMVVAGKVTGNILCKDELHITETAATEGDIQTNSLIVDHGAGISGALVTRKKSVIEPINIDEAIKNSKVSDKKQRAENA